MRGNLVVWCVSAAPFISARDSRLALYERASTKRRMADARGDRTVRSAHIWRTSLPSPRQHHREQPAATKDDDSSHGDAPGRGPRGTSSASTFASPAARRATACLRYLTPPAGARVLHASDVCAQHALGCEVTSKESHATLCTHSAAERVGAGAALARVGTSEVSRASNDASALGAACALQRLALARHDEPREATIDDRLCTSTSTTANVDYIGQPAAECASPMECSLPMSNQSIHQVCGWRGCVPACSSAPSRAPPPVHAPVRGLTGRRGQWECGRAHECECILRLDLGLGDLVGG